MKSIKFSAPSLFLLAIFYFYSCRTKDIDVTHVFEIKEIVLTAQNQYENPYTDVECWVDLKGPDFDKRIYGFWDGGQVFKVRIAAIKSGEWSWISGSTTSDSGLNQQQGSFKAIEWTEQEKEANNNRRGFIRPTSNGHALEYADGTPFFFIGDTWYAASTWRFPLVGKAPDLNWIPEPDSISFENIVHYRQQQGYNSLAMISSFPNWAADSFPSKYTVENNIGVRAAWEKFGANTAKDMHDELGNRAFAIKNGGPIADFDKINPAYFQSLDKKMDYLALVGFVPFLETVRRDHAPTWKAFFEWPNSFVRYVQYIAARYGAYNILFSPIHLDHISETYGLSGEEFNDAILAWYNKYGSLPYGQPTTTLINGATHITFGIGDKVPWLTMNSVGNKPRNHGIYPWLEEQFNFEKHKPTANLEAYYPGWGGSLSNIAGEMAPRNSDRDNYFGRTQAWGSVFSGGLSGHMYGTGAYDATTVGEEKGSRPFIWEALKYPAGEQVGYLRKFMESEGKLYREFQLASEDLHPRKSEGSLADGLDGWAFMLSIPNRNLRMVYFENKCEAPMISGFATNKNYQLNWFNPISGKWLEKKQMVSSDEKGILRISNFPDGETVSNQDWSLKIRSYEK
jgi:hypothetical protein